MSDKRSIATKSKKVPQNKTTVKLLKLTCEDCGEEDETLLKCPHCESTCVIAEIIERLQEEVDGIAVETDDSEDEDEAELTPEEKEFENIVSEGGLSDIFPGEGSTEGDEDDLAAMSMDEVVDLLDQE